MKNEENDFVINQMEGLKKQYTEERDAMPDHNIKNPMMYMEKFQEFTKPPIISEEINNHEYYRPNPAAFQRKLNENPYSVDVGFSKVDNPVYGNHPRMDVVDTRANTRFYNTESRNFRTNRVDTVGDENIRRKPFSSVKYFFEIFSECEYENLR